MRVSIGIAVCVAMAGCKAGTTEGPTASATKEPVPQAQPPQPAPYFSVLEGDYAAGHPVYYYDAETDEDVLAGEFADVLTIKETPDGALRAAPMALARGRHVSKLRGYSGSDRDGDSDHLQLGSQGRVLRASSHAGGLVSDVGTRAGGYPRRVVGDVRTVSEPMLRGRAPGCVPRHLRPPAEADNCRARLA